MKFHGSVSVGDRGQIVIPVDVREALNIRPGDKLLIFKAPVKDALVVAKPESFEKHVQEMNEQAEKLREHINEDK